MAPLTQEREAQAVWPTPSLVMGGGLRILNWGLGAGRGTEGVRFGKFTLLHLKGLFAITPNII